MDKHTASVVENVVFAMVMGGWFCVIMKLADKLPKSR